MTTAHGIRRPTHTPQRRCTDICNRHQSLMASFVTRRYGSHIFHKQWIVLSYRIVYCAVPGQFTAYLDYISSAGCYVVEGIGCIG